MWSLTLGDQPNEASLIMNNSYDFARTGGLSALIDWLFGGA